MCREGASPEDYQNHASSLAEKGVKLFDIGERGLRAVVHRQIDDSAIERALEIFSAEFSS